jgi:hypothetical protein
MEEHAAYGIGFTSTLHPEAVQVGNLLSTGAMCHYDRFRLSAPCPEWVPPSFSAYQEERGATAVVDFVSVKA